MVSWDARIKSSSKRASLDATCFDIKYLTVHKSGRSDLKLNYKDINRTEFIIILLQHKYAYASLWV